VIGFGARSGPFVASERAAEVPAEQVPRLTRLIEAQYPFVWRLLRRIGFAESDADDVAQQVFVTVSRRIADIRPGSERAFLSSTALHVASRARRNRTRKREAFGVELDQELDPAPNPADLLEQRRARAVLDSLLQEMPLDLRIVFALYELEELTTSEIAEAIGVPLGTVASRLRRAREDFAARVARFGARRKLGEPAP
jgi:RNA polymerase sigma-70 factor (ECF subfamily)